VLLRVQRVGIHQGAEDEPKEKLYLRLGAKVGRKYRGAIRWIQAVYLSSGFS
jgi:hypothetical protein